MGSRHRALDYARLSVLMPIYNEGRTLREIVERVLSVPFELELEVVCVDDCSSDNSWALLQELAKQDRRIRILRHDRNRGKGAAIRTAIKEMTGDVAVVQDSDLEYDPAELPRVLRPILDGRADAVFGSRFAASPERRVLLYWHSLGNKFLTWLTNVLNDLNLTDMETCYKAMSADVLRHLRLRNDRFGIEPEITTRLAQWGARIYEVPISYHGRGYAEGKNIGWRDGVQAIWLLLMYRFLDTRFTTRSGTDALESMAVSSRISRWTLAQFRPFIGSRVLEAGFGVGNLTRHLLDRERLVALDRDEFYVRNIERKWGHLANVSVFAGDLEDPAVYDKISDSFDTVVAVNVLEHLRGPAEVLGRWSELLNPRGTVAVLVPAHPWLFSEVDRAVGHQARYRREDLRRLLEGSGYDVVKLEAFNRFGVVGWLVNKITGATRIKPWQMRLYSMLMPLGLLLEKVRWLPGLSWVAIARKP
jgi:glycosyltransferase involved in cell wall biosynthesis